MCLRVEDEIERCQALELAANWEGARARLTAFGLLHKETTSRIDDGRLTELIRTSVSSREFLFQSSKVSCLHHIGSPRPSRLSLRQKVSKSVTLQCTLLDATVDCPVHGDLSKCSTNAHVLRRPRYAAFPVQMPKSPAPFLIPRSS